VVKKIAGLRALELEFEATQQAIRDQRVLEHLSRAEKTDKLVNTLIDRCKTHGGPFTKLAELEQWATNFDPDNDSHRLTLRSEVWLKRKTIGMPETDPHLRINKVSGRELLANLTVLLGGMEAAPTPDSLVQSASEDDILAALTNTSAPPQTLSTKEGAHEIGDVCAVQVSCHGNAPEWQLAVVTCVEDELRVQLDLFCSRFPGEPPHVSKAQWVLPADPECVTVASSNLIPVDVHGGWQRCEDSQWFEVSNHNEVSASLLPVLGLVV
jgi:hypothetical protein